MPGPVSRSVSIYIDVAAAEQSAEKLRKKIDQLEQTIARGQAAGRDMAAQIGNLANARAQLNQTNEIIAGRMTPSMRMLTQQATKLRNELAGMSRDAPGFQEKLKQYQAVNRELDKMATELRGVSGVMQSLKDGLAQGVGLSGGLGIGNAIKSGINWLKDLVKTSVEAASKMEQLRVAYTTLLGSKSASNEFIKDLQKFAANTPFEFNEVAELSKQLLAFGFSQKELIPTLTMLGNIASGVGKEKLPNLILAFSQIRNQGKLMAQDLNQLVNAGFNPLKTISEKTGKGMGDLRKDMANGLVTFDMVKDAFKSVTEQGGRFYKLMDNQSKTTSGTLSNLKDNWAQVLTIMGEPANQALKWVYSTLGGMVGFIKEMISLSPADEVRKEKDELNGLVFALMNVNDNQELKNQLIAEIQAKYPQFLSYIDAENASTQQLGKALEIVNQQYDHKIRLAALSQRQEKNSDKSLDLQNAYLDAQQKLADRLKLDVVTLSRMSAEERKAAIKQSVQNELAVSEQSDLLDKMLAGAGGSEGSRGVKITDEYLLKQYASLDEDFAKKKQALDDERLKVMGQIGAENERQLAQDKESLRVANENVKAIEKGKEARIAAYEFLFKDRKQAVAAYEQELAQAKRLASGIELAMNPVEATTPQNSIGEDAKSKKAREKAEKLHDKAVKDVKDLQGELKRLQDDVAAAQVDADAGFENKFGKQIQTVVDKYEKLMKKVSDRLAVIGGLTKTENDALTQLLQDLTNAEYAELDILQQKQFKERTEAEYTKELKSLGDYYEQQQQLAEQAYSDGTISYEEYKKKLLSLDTQEAISRATMAEDYADNVKAAAEDLEKARTEAHKKGNAERRALEEQERDETKARLQRDLVMAKKGSQEAWLAQRAIIINNYNESKRLKKDNSAEVALLDAQEKDELMVLDKQYWMDKLQNIATVLASVGSLVTNFVAYLNQGDQAQLDKETDNNDKKKKNYQQMLDKKQISQEQYQKLVDESDAETEKKEIEIKKRMAKREKAAALFNAVIQTAQAVLQALASAPPPYSFILAALAGAAGAVQIATIANQKEPQYSKGGIFNKKGGIAKGASHANGGISMIDANGQKVGEMEGNEAYMILSQKTTSANRDIIEQLLASSMSGDGKRITPDWMFEPPQQINYKDAVETIEYTRQYRNGGITIPTKPTISNATPGSTSSDQSALNDLASVLLLLNQKLEEPLQVKASIVWSEFEQKREQYDRLVKAASFNPG